MSLIISSIIDLSPLAPVFLSIALSTISSNALSSNSSSTSSIWNSFLYCFTNAFFGFVTISINAFLSNSSSVAIIGKRPTNSGINPNFSKSCGNICLKISLLFKSLLLSITAPKPIDFLPILSFTIFSNPSKAPPQINNIFEVSTCKNS